MIPLVLLACSGSDEPKLAEAPDPEASRALAASLCKLVEGAGHDCEQKGAEAVIDGKDSLKVEAWLDGAKEEFGQFTFDGRATVARADGTAVTTRFQHYGWGKVEALDHGTQYWAVLSGVGIVDWVLKDPKRPALRSLEHDDMPPVTHWPLGAFRALRGWTLLRGVKVDLDHQAILAALRPRLEALDASAPHTAHVRIASDLGEQVFTCHVDGVAAPELCEAAKGYAWPAGIGWELQQVYVLVPAASFPEAPPEPAE
jgi:hypothetical protein